MTARDFCYWLQGYFEISGQQPQPPEPHGMNGLNSEQVKMIERHLALVFKHEIDPSQGTPEKQAELQQIHDGGKPSFLDSGFQYRC